jgi:hypothetical protein
VDASSQKKSNIEVTDICQLELGLP